MSNILQSSKSSTCLSSIGRAMRDERGGATLWNLFWLTGFMAMAGLTIDTTNGRRIQTMMTSTADVASLAGAMELPMPHRDVAYNEGEYVTSVQDAADSFAVTNLDTGTHGDFFVKDEDVYVGHWDSETRQFTWGGGSGKPINAVKLFMGRHENRGARINTTLLRTLGINHYNVAVEATAVMEIPDCFQNGIVAGNEVKINSNATFYSGTCLHGQEGVDIQNNNTWWPETGVSANFGKEIRMAPNQYDQNNVNGHKVPQMHRNLEPSAMVYDIINVGAAMLDLDGTWQQHYGYNSDYALMRDPDMQDPAQPVIEMDKFTIGDTVPETSSSTGLEDGTQVASVGGLTSISAASSTSSCSSKPNPQHHMVDMADDFEKSCPGSNLAEGRTYYAPCANKLTIDGVIRNVVIVSECKVSIRSNSVLENVMLVVLDDGKHKSAIDKKAASAGSDVRFGAKDQCAHGGGVRMWVRGDFHASSGSEWYGAQIYIGNDLDMAGQTEASNGLSAHVANDAHISAQVEFAGVNDSVVWDEGTKACPGNVGWDWIRSDYQYVLVE